MSALTIASCRRSVNRCARGVALLGAALFPSLVPLPMATRAEAHPQFTAASVNRYIKVDLIAADRVRIVYTLMLGEGPAMAERRLADADASGSLSDRERDTIGERARADVARGLQLWLDGKPVALALGPPVVGLAGAAVSNEPFSIDVELVLAPGVGRHRLRVLDERDEKTAAAESEIRLVESPHVQIVAADRGEPTPGKRQLQFLFSGPKRTSLEDRSVTVDFDATEAPGEASRRSAIRIVGGLLGGVLLGAAAWWLRRRYFSMKG